jgi:periplasmic protein TonB
MENTNQPAEIPPIDAQLIEQSVPAATQSIQPGQPSAMHQPKPLPPVRPQQVRVMPQVSPRTEQNQAPPVKPQIAPLIPQVNSPIEQQNPAAQKAEVTTNAAVPVPSAATSAGTHTTLGAGQTRAEGNTSANSGAQPGSYDGKGSSRGNLYASSGARAIVRPMPQIPDDLRGGAFNTAALARFHIAVDGSAKVELAKPTPNPRLNRILLDSLKKWRFIPAIKNGKPVASTEEIVVKIEVK